MWPPTRLCSRRRSDPGCRGRMPAAAGRNVRPAVSGSSMDWRPVRNARRMRLRWRTGWGWPTRCGLPVNYGLNANFVCADCCGQASRPSRIQVRHVEHFARPPHACAHGTPGSKRRLEQSLAGGHIKIHLIRYRGYFSHIPQHSFATLANWPIVTPIGSGGSGD